MIDKTNETGILVTLDQEKAFDRVDHEFLMCTLTKFGFGPDFCWLVHLFYNNVFSRIICNGQLTDPVFLQRGVRQGCHLSPLLYVLVSEVLSTQIRNCNSIVGFQLPGKFHSMPMTPPILLKTKCLCNLLRVVSKYEKGSGAKLNTSKSEAMWLGGWRHNGASPFGLKWVKKIRILGAYFSAGLVSVDNDNWKSKLDKLQSVLNLWSSHELSFLGRAMIVNVLGASCLWHVAKILPPPKHVVDRYKSIVWPFIWKGKIEPISRQRCSALMSEGGLNIANFSVKCTSLRLSNVASLRDNFGSEKWHYMARYFLGNRLAKFDTRFPFSSNAVPACSTPSCFYQLCFHKFLYLFSTYGHLLENLTCKNIYLLLLALPSCIPKSAGFWGAIVGRSINRWASIWRKSRLKLNENKKNDLLWLTLHRAVKVRYALKTWGYIENGNCALCGRIETIEHCFLECQRVTAVWNHFSPSCLTFCSPLFLSQSPLFFTLSASQSTSSTSIYNFLVVTILFWIWFARNQSTFCNSLLTSQSILSLTINPCHAASGKFRTHKYVHMDGSWNIPDFRISSFLQQVSSVTLGLGSGSLKC